MAASAVCLQEVTKIYKKSHLGRVKTSLGVENLSLEVREGEVFGLLGLNGSGKTTTIKLILDLLFPTRGSLSVFGRPVSDLQTKKHIGYLPEVPYFYKYLSAREVLKFYGGLSGMAPSVLPSRIDEVLKVVHMQAQAHRPMREYSKGMLQRVGLAQAMLHDPKIMVLDEPVTGLDPLGLKEMRELIVSLNRAGKTIFFSSHNIAEVEKLCHRAAILVKGRLAKTLEQKDWMEKGSSLENIFVQTVSSQEPAGPR